jgi:homoserine O-acetyltransferase
MKLPSIRSLHATVARTQIAQERIRSVPLVSPTTRFSTPKTDKLIHREQPYQVYKHHEVYKLVHGKSLPEFQIAYEAWGKMNHRRDNVILLHTGLSASSHAKAHEGNRAPGWWEKFIGPGLPLDTNKFYIICTNVLGGCFGSTGPSSTSPDSKEPYATTFPIVTLFDMVRAQFRLLDYLGIDRLHASVGASMGGMQSLCAAAMFPDRVDRLVTISACARSHPYSIAVRHTQRQGM